MISKLAVVETDQLGENVIISEFSVIRDNVKIGNNVIIHPNVVIESGVVVGNNVEIFPGAYIGKEPKGTSKGVLSRTPSFERSVTIGSNVSIGPHTIIYYDVEIGDFTLIGDGASIREKCKIGSKSVIGRFVTINYLVKIGDRTKVMDHSWLAGNMTVGDDVFISGGVLTSNDNAIGREGYDESKMVGPIIEDRAKIGIGALILPCVVIRHDAIVGAGAVVTKNVAPHSVVMGVPAKFVRSATKNELKEKPTFTIA